MVYFFFVQKNHALKILIIKPIWKRFVYESYTIYNIHVQCTWPMICQWAQYTATTTTTKNNPTNWEICIWNLEICLKLIRWLTYLTKLKTGATSAEFTGKWRGKIFSFNLEVLRRVNFFIINYVQWIAFILSTIVLLKYMRPLDTALSSLLNGDGGMQIEFPILLK